MTAPTSYTPLVDQQLSLFHLMRPTERIQSTIETLRRLSENAAQVGAIEQARALETLSDMYLRDAILLRCIESSYIVPGLAKLYWSAPTSHLNELAVITHVGSKLSGMPASETLWWGALHAGATFSDPTLTSLQQMATTFTNERMRGVFEGTIESIIEDVETLELEWEDTFSELVRHLGLPSEARNR